MFKKKRADVQTEGRDDIGYHEVDDHRRGVKDTNIAKLSVSTCKDVHLAALYRHRGVLWAITSVCISTACSICIKLLAGKVAASQILFFRGFAQVLFSLPHLVYHKVSLSFPFKTSALILSRALIGSMSTILNYYAFQVIPVATAKALIYSSPLFTGIFARICLGERCSVGIVFFAFLTVVSVMLVIQPPFIFGGGDVGKFAGILCAVVGAIVLSANTIILRFMQILRIDVHAIIFIYGFIAMFCSGVVTTALGEWTNPDCGLDRWIVIGVAVTGFLEQVSITLALKTVPALVVSIIRTNDVLLSFAFDFLIFGIVPNAWTIVGAFLVVGSAIGMTITANREQKRQEELEVSSEEQSDGLHLSTSCPVLPK